MQIKYFASLEYLQIIKDAAVRWNFPKITEVEAWQ